MPSARPKRTLLSESPSFFFVRCIALGRIAIDVRLFDLVLALALCAALGRKIVFVLPIRFVERPVNFPRARTLRTQSELDRGIRIVTHADEVLALGIAVDVPAVALGQFARELADLHRSSAA
jgi:hypothetical protein